MTAGTIARRQLFLIVAPARVAPRPVAGALASSSNGQPAPGRLLASRCPWQAGPPPTPTMDVPGLPCPRPVFCLGHLAPGFLPCLLLSAPACLAILGILHFGCPMLCSSLPGQQTPPSRVRLRSCRTTADASSSTAVRKFCFSGLVGAAGASFCRPWALLLPPLPRPSSCSELPWALPLFTSRDIIHLDCPVLSLLSVMVHLGCRWRRSRAAVGCHTAVRKLCPAVPVSAAAGSCRTAARGLSRCRRSNSALLGHFFQHLRVDAVVAAKMWRGVTSALVAGAYAEDLAASSAVTGRSGGLCRQSRRAELQEPQDEPPRLPPHAAPPVPQTHPIVGLRPAPARTAHRTGMAVRGRQGPAPRLPMHRPPNGNGRCRAGKGHQLTQS